MLNKKIAELIKKLRLIDDIFFSAYFENNPKDVQYILRIILDKPDLKVWEVQTQKSVENIYGRSVRLDVFATDEDGKLYNIEVQRTDAGAIPARARCNSSMLDYHELAKQKNFDELPETFVIFITEHDVLRGGKKIYHIDRIVRETQKNFADGTHIIYVNGSYKGEPGNPLNDLIHDFFCENSGDMCHRQLAESIQCFKDNKFGGSNMSSVIREFFKDELAECRARGLREGREEGRMEGRAEGRAEGKTEGREETLLENIRALMETTKWTVEQVMDALKIPADKRDEYRALI